MSKRLAPRRFKLTSVFVATSN